MQPATTRMTGKRALQSTATIVNNVDEIVCDRLCTLLGPKGPSKLQSQLSLRPSLPKKVAR
eukprot:2897225-Amphidinium_carterae.1